MKNFDGYLKQKLGNDYVLLAGGSHKALSDFSMSGHKHAYTDLTGSSTTANQVIVSTGTANGWTLKTLGDRAFDSNTYLKTIPNIGYETIKQYGNYSVYDTAEYFRNYLKYAFEKAKGQLVGGVVNPNSSGYSILFSYDYASSVSGAPQYAAGLYVFYGNMYYYGYNNGTYFFRTLYHDGNLPAYPTKSSWNYDDRYVSELGTSNNYLTWTKNGTTNTITVPYATNSSNATSATYLNPQSYTPINNTVGGHKAGLINWMNTDGNTGIGKHVIVGASIIAQWNNDSATYYDSSVWAMIKIGGGYNQSTYGQWLLSSYSTNRVGIIGRSEGNWDSGGIRWIAYTSDIPTTMSWSNITSKPNLVNTFGSKTGDITLLNSQSSNGAINLTMSGNQLQASIVGLGDRAFDSKQYLPAYYPPYYENIKSYRNYSGTSTQEYLKNLCMYAYDKAKGSTIAGSAHPNGVGSYLMHTYSDTGSTTGVPKYSSGIYIGLQDFWLYGYSNNNWYAYTLHHSGNLSFSSSTNSISITSGSTTYSLTNTWRGITDSYSGTDSTISLSQKGGKNLYDSLVNGYANTAGSATSAKYLLPGSYTADNNTVAGHKSGIVKWMNTIGTCIGSYIIVGASIIAQWSNDSATYYDSSVYSFMKIGGGYSGSTYGQWLLSSCATSRVGYVGRTGNNWTTLRWFIDTDGNQTINGNLTCTNFYTTSDARKKQNIHKISDNIKQFEWKETGETSYGFVAQDLEVKHPELVNDDGNMKTVNYNAALSLVVAKLENRVKELEAKLGLETPPPVFNQG